MLAFIGGTIDMFFFVPFVLSFLKRNTKNFKEVKVLTVSLPKYQLLASPSVPFSNVLYKQIYKK